MERAQIDTAEGNPAATLSSFVGVLALVAGPAIVLGQRYSLTVTLHAGIALGGAVAGGLAVLTLLLARRGRLRATRNIADVGARAARTGRFLGTLALCVAIAAGIALATDAFLRHFQ
jgi:hypothetical protein